MTDAQAYADILRRIGVDTDVAERLGELIAMGGLEWAAVAAAPDAEHAAGFAESLRITRERFDLGDEPRELHGVYLKGGNTVLCHTGTSPNSGMHAKIIVGLFNSMANVVKDMRAEEMA